MKKLVSKEVLIGAITLVALAILFFGIDFLKGINVFKAANYYYVTFNEVQGLAQSARVNLNGFQVGLVREIAYDYDNPGHVKVELSLDRELKIPEGTEALLVTDLLGTAAVDLKLGTSSQIVPVGSTLPGKTPSGMMAAVTDNLLPSVGAIFPKVDTLLTQINMLVADPAVAGSVQRLDQITANLAESTAALQRMMASMPPIVENVNTLTGNLATASADVSQLTATAKDLPLDSLMTSLQATATNLQALSRELNNPNSTLGLMMHDPALYNNLNHTVASLDSLFVDIKKNPKRYISIKLL